MDEWDGNEMEMINEEWKWEWICEWKWVGKCKWKWDERGII